MGKITSSNMESMLSKRELEFIELLNTVECMSVYEADYLLRTYLKCTSGQVKKMLNHLKGMYYLSVTSDAKYIISGNRVKGIGEGSLSKDMIFAIWLALMQFKEDKEVFENVKYMNKPMGDGELAFISKGKLYRIYTIKSSEMYKIKLIEEKYSKKSRRLNNDRCTDNGYEEISIFAFMEPHREEHILKKLEELGITIPHSIAILNNADLSADIGFNRYDVFDYEDEE